MWKMAATEKVEELWVVKYRRCYFTKTDFTVKLKNIIRIKDFPVIIVRS